MDAVTDASPSRESDIGRQRCDLVFNAAGLPTMDCAGPVTQSMIPRVSIGSL